MPTDTAVVTAAFSRRMRLRLDSGAYVEARIKGKRLKPVCGDRVEAEPLEREADWLITAIRPRRNTLSRPNLSGQVEVLAANIDLLVAVTAGAPAPDWYVIDRYLCAAELMPADALVVYNKVDMDLMGTEEQRELENYRQLGYTAVATSATTGEGLDRLGAELAGTTACVVGQSGVGKSTLINCLSGDASQRTAEISEKRDEGRHTTVNSVMLPLAGGGAVIDSPGVRDYAPAIDDIRQVGRGFREIAAAADGCRFANCRHLREPGCAVKLAVDHGTIGARRYESYRRLYILTDKLGDKRR